MTDPSTPEHPLTHPRVVSCHLSVLVAVVGNPDNRLLAVVADFLVVARTDTRSFSVDFGSRRDIRGAVAPCTVDLRDIRVVEVHGTTWYENKTIVI